MGARSKSALLLIGETLAGTEGLGLVLIKAIDRNNVQLIMALTLLLFVLSSALNAILLAIEHRLHRRAVRDAGPTRQ